MPSLNCLLSVSFSPLCSLSLIIFFSCVLYFSTSLRGFSATSIPIFPLSTLVPGSPELDFIASSPGAASPTRSQDVTPLISHCLWDGRQMLPVLWVNLPLNSCSSPVLRTIIIHILQIITYLRIAYYFLLWCLRVFPHESHDWVVL